MVNRRLAVDLELFSRGGMCVLDKIEQQGYDVLSRRPKISKVERVGLLVGTLARALHSTAAGRMTSLEAILRALPRQWRRSARGISIIRSFCFRRRRKTPCARCTRSCVIATI